MNIDVRDNPVMGDGLSPILRNLPRRMGANPSTKTTLLSRPTGARHE